MHGARAVSRVVVDRILPSTVDRAINVIEARYRDPLTLRTIACAVQRDRAYLARLFRRATGHTLHGYLTRVRVKHATTLIAEGQKVEAVMLQVGYRSKKNFYRQFRSITGVTPGAYRRIDPGRTVRDV